MKPVIVELLLTRDTSALLSDVERLGEDSRLRTCVRRRRYGEPMGDLEAWWERTGFELALSRGLL